MKRKERCVITEHVSLAADIRLLKIKTALAKEAKPGQFAMLSVPDQSMLLPRPISVFDADAVKETLSFVYRVAGAGTARMATLIPGEEMTVMGMAGNGFPLEEAYGKTAYLIGGGVGIPPLFFAAKQLVKEKKAKRVCVIAGYRDSETFLSDAFAELNGADFRITTDDGSAGYRGNAAMLFRELLKDVPTEPKVVFTCGPKPMLRAVKEITREQTIPAWLSLEERMACGVGVCLGCVAETTKEDAHSHVKNARVCADGPVFFAEDAVL